MDFRPVSDYEAFHSLMTAYYREGEDADTPQEELDAFISYLYDLNRKGTISGCLAWEETPVGFCLWWVDTEELPFTHKPGWGTIMEMGLVPDARKKGYGRQLAAYAESNMDVTSLYVCAYGPAEAFWKSCGYQDRGEMARNDLKLLVKQKEM